MGKRSTFARIERDCYDTPPEAVAPLIPHLPKGCTYWEPCAGAGELIFNIPRVCILATDIAPRDEYGAIDKYDALGLMPILDGIDLIITNPPWTRSILHEMILHFSDMRPTWLLFDADWMHTKQAIPYLPRLHKIVSVGRVKWIKDSPHTGKDNCCWYLFDQPSGQQPKFFGRQNYGQGR